MSPRFQNLTGTLAWIATRDPELSEAYNALWDKAKNKDEKKERLARVVVALQLEQDIPAERFSEAEATLCAAFWIANPSVTPLGAKKTTGPPARYRSEIKRMLDLVNTAEIKAIDAGIEPAPRPTNNQIADQLSQRHRTKVSERTVAHNVKQLGGNVNWLLLDTA